MKSLNKFSFNISSKISSHLTPTKTYKRIVMSAVVVAAQIFMATTALYVSSADAAPRCSLRTLVERSSEAAAETQTFKVSKINGAEGIRLKAATMTKMKKIFEKKSKQLEATDIKGIVEAAGALVTTADKKPSVEKSNKMAEIGRDILKAAKPDLSDAQYKMVSYLIAEAVMKFETIPLSEYKTARNELPVFKKKSTLHIDKFNDLVESYVDGTAGYRDMSTDGGFLSWPEIRGLYTNNSWAIGIRNHDMYHLHYSYGHPYYLAVNMHASRTINDRRYAMISTLWEAVDTFRTGYESSLAGYFRGRNMSVEEGMLFIAGATEKELDKMEETVGSYTQLSSLSELAYAQGWRPVKTKFGRGTTRYTQETQFQEIATFINDSLARMKVERNSRYGNYHRLGPGNTSATDQNTIP